MDHTAAQKSDGARKPGARTRLPAFALLACVLASTTGCASHTWAFSTSRMVTGNDTDASCPNHERPSIAFLLPCLVIDFVFFPVAIIHDIWPRSPGHDVDD